MEAGAFRRQKPLGVALLEATLSSEASGGKDTLIWHLEPFTGTVAFAMRERARSVGTRRHPHTAGQAHSMYSEWIPSPGRKSGGVLCIRSPETTRPLASPLKKWFLGKFWVALALPVPSSRVCFNTGKASGTLFQRAVA